MSENHLFPSSTLSKTIVVMCVLVCCFFMSVVVLPVYAVSQLYKLDESRMPVQNKQLSTYMDAQGALLSYTTLVKRCQGVNSELSVVDAGAATECSESSGGARSCPNSRRSLTFLARKNAVESIKPDPTTK